MKKYVIIGVFFAAAFLISMGLSGCDVFNRGGTVSLSITDSPIDASNVSGVWITVKEIQYHRSDTAGWVPMEGFQGPQKINLLELTDGSSKLLGELNLFPGHYTQIRFILDIEEMSANGSVPQNPGCYISFNDGSSDAPLFVPGSGVSGYKAVGAFDVPVNGAVSITADFDIRKAVVKTGNGSYILKPTIRLVADNEAGKIAGEVTNYTGTGNLLVFAYEDGTYKDTEDDDPVATTDPELAEPRFPGAVAGTGVSKAGDGSLHYVLSFLTEGTYDLVVAEYNGDTFVQTLGFVSNVSVVSNKTTPQVIDAVSLDTAVR
ncbi:MAG: DUF4382 domain-containing protein [Spirochaetes bacterium]|nr:DUF4382 domain-containing protein [Spirochaetota bacterium]